MKKLTYDNFTRLRKLIHRSARPLDYSKWKYLFENGSCEDFLSILASYQNDDGGFGYNIECNNWNPNSSPYTVCIALDYLDIVDDYVSLKKDTIVDGIIKYLASGSFFLEDGWVGMQGVPTNNDFAHMPWFHYNIEKGSEANISVTKRLSAFIIQYSDENSDIHRIATNLKEKYEKCHQTLVSGFPDYDPTSFDIEGFDPETWPLWLPLPVHFVGLPESEHYTTFKDIVESNLDYIVNVLSNIEELQMMPAEALEEFERNNPHPDGKRWCTSEQAIGNHYSDAQNITTNINILRKFDRLDFELPFL